MSDLEIRTVRDWIPETRSLLRRLTRAGFTVTEVSDGEDCVDFESEAQALEHVTSADSGVLYLQRPGGASGWILLVFGNSPGELPSDYSSSPLLDQVIQEHHSSWETRGQPKCLRLSGWYLDPEKGNTWAWERFTDRAAAEARMAELAQA